jgi:hypothetical protein
MWGGGSGGGVDVLMGVLGVWGPLLYVCSLCLFSLLPFFVCFSVLFSDFFCFFADFWPLMGVGPSSLCLFLYVYSLYFRFFFYVKHGFFL